VGETIEGDDGARIGAGVDAENGDTDCVIVGLAGVFVDGVNWYCEGFGVSGCL